MIQTHEKFRLRNINLEGKNLEVEINYRGEKDFVYDEIEGKKVPVKDEDKVLRFKIGDEVAEIRYTDLWTVAFMAGSGVNQTALAPVKWSSQRFINQHLKIKAHKDIKRGESIIVKHTVKIPERFFQQVHMDSGIVVPKITPEGRDLLMGKT